MIDALDAVGRFERSTRSFLDALASVSERAWRLRPAGEAWSLAETVEHVVLTDRSVRGRLQQLLAAPFPAGAPRFDDAAISAAMFETAGPPPPGFAEPTGRFATCAEGISALIEIRDARGELGGHASRRRGVQMKSAMPAALATAAAPTRVTVKVGVAYGTDPARVHELLLHAAHADHRVLASPEPASLFIAFGVSSLDFELRVYVQTVMDRLAVQNALDGSIAALFAEHGIEIAFPQMDVHVRDLPAAAATPADDAPRTVKPVSNS